MIDFQSTLLDPIYLIHGVPVDLTLADGREFDELTAIDKTDGIEVGDGVNVQTVKPAAAFRVAELRGYDIDVDELPGAILEMNRLVWKVQSYLLKPNPGGERNGEVFLILGRHS